MADGLASAIGIPYDPGAEPVNSAIPVRTVTLHRTIGTWPGDYSVGKTRSHAQGTFQFLIGQGDGQWVQFYPADNYASHAYGANEAGPGVEISGQNGEPLTDWQIDALGRLMRWFRDEWNVAEVFAEGDPRAYADQLGPLGFITHSHVYSPDPRYTHYDYITEEEWARAFAGGAPPPAPPAPLEEELMASALNYNGQLTSFQVQPNGELTELWVASPTAAWSGAVIAKGARVGAQIAVVRDWGGKDRLDLFVEADKGGTIHAWYIPGAAAFSVEVL